MNFASDDSLLPATTALSPADWEALRQAHRRLEHPGFAARVSSRLGAPLEKILGALPDPWCESLQKALHTTLERTLAVAIHSLGKERPMGRSTRYHKLLGALSGAAGGLFGLPAVLAELPVTSAIMLRSIADIARSQGEDLSDPEARLACMEVFALGGRSKGDRAADTGYYGIRIALGLHLSRLPQRVVNQGIVQWNPPSLVRFIAEIAARFGVVVTEKAAVQMVPIIGAGTGSLVNVVFMEHFQEIARAHFTMRRLERTYGTALMRAEYRRLTRRDTRAVLA
ncbi:EcsC family protein [Candidatus Methylocalor cossyra]|uniref:EcsC protein family protein n=1 Tax=Candidatus Methylocalor cossyra TaxID=3108543 RepID=A0ABM9NKT3_9GAMM